MTTILAPTDSDATAGAAEAPGTPRLVRAELLKIFTTSMWWIMGIAALLATGLALLINVSNLNARLAAAEQLAQHRPDFPGEGLSAAEQQRRIQEFAEQTDIPGILARGAADIYTSGQYLGLLLVALLGALVVTNEFQHQTATATFLTTPDRAKVITAKLRAVAILAAGYWLLATAFSVGVGALFATLQGHAIPYSDPGILRAVGINLLAYALWSVLGVGLGVLMRGQLGATLVTTGVYLSGYAALILFGLIRSLVPSDAVYDVAILVPSVASIVMLSPEELAFDADTFGPAWWVGALVLIGYGIAAGVIGTLITRRRDIS